MDSYRGSLAHFRMHLLVPVLYEKDSQSGIVRVERGTLHREFLIRRGHIVAQSSNDPREHLGQLLVELGILEGPRAAEAFEAAQEAGRPFGEYLVQSGLVERTRLERALIHKAREAFFDCYAWEVGELEFIPCDIPGRGFELRMHLGTLHREAVERQREWRTFHAIFPDLEACFRVDASRLGADAHEHDLMLVALAESGASLGTLLRDGREDRLLVSRRITSLYRKGALSPQRSREPLPNESTRLAQLISHARSSLARGRFEQARQLAAEALDRGPVDEAHALYREAEQRLTVTLSDALMNLSEPLKLEPVPNPVPSQVTVDDLYLYSRLRSGKSVKEIIGSAPMGEHAAFHGLWRLVQNGLVSLPTLPEERAADTVKYGRS